jgi:hypothetical protein
MLKATVTEVMIHSDIDMAMITDTTTINLVDEGGGRFITITQYDDNFKEIVIRLDPNEITTLFANINMMISQ